MLNCIFVWVAPRTNIKGDSCAMRLRIDGSCALTPSLSTHTRAAASVRSLKQQWCLRAMICLQDGLPSGEFLGEAKLGCFFPNHLVVVFGHSRLPTNLFRRRRREKIQNTNQPTGMINLGNIWENRNSSVAFLEKKRFLDIRTFCTGRVSTTKLFCIKGGSIVQWFAMALLAQLPEVQFLAFPICFFREK